MVVSAINDERMMIVVRVVMFSCEGFQRNGNSVQMLD